MLEKEEKKKTLRLLAFESSCDDTSIAAVEGLPDEPLPRLISYSVQNQTEVHEKYGGVVPELACRAHLRNLLPCLEKVLTESKFPISEFDAFAATERPGLIGSLLIGHTAAKTLSLLYQKPFISCHHLEGHLMSIFLNHRPTFPYLALVVSGGHTSLYRVESYDQLFSLGVTLDDAVGEAFDKGARLLGLPFPGGPEIERLARKGNDQAYAFGQVDVPNLNFSFSGLKSEMARLVSKNKNELHKENAAASYQKALLDHTESKIKKALKETQLKRLCIVGGVARNSFFRQRLENLKTQGILEQWFAPPLEFCTDNAAMIAFLAYRRLKRKEFSDLSVDVGSTSRPERRKKSHG